MKDTSSTSNEGNTIETTEFNFNIDNNENNSECVDDVGLLLNTQLDF